ncbi:hypothetical protein [Flavobacterium sp. CF136]|uniref:hypothetical protein n=1 Tax=Flavobacterium sp. (strain CF136) TaxID=1144313 RepID=UPI0002715263|nr:hypothetical protein [Flavobacterium sp. CF136]EJL65245.1 hypothetical protein PMI10_01438 [Flavobacterium sp. CF136]
MYDFSIEHNAQKINSPETKLFFKEVSSSYFNDNYRAAVVTLYSVVIVDILGKLETLYDMYSDPAAEAILDQIRGLQAANSVGSEWEKVLIEEVKTRTNLLNNIDHARILSLRGDRHLCAHPVLDRGDKLYTPNRETVAAHIRNMLESVLQKPVILSKKILKVILVDIAANASILIGDELEKYIQSKYLQNLDSITEVAIFKELWKFVFRLEDEESSVNRELNYRLLTLLYKKNFVVCDQKIKEDSKYYSTVANLPEAMSLIVDFLARHGELYQDFTADFKLVLKKFVLASPNAVMVCWFLEGDFVKHLAKLKVEIPKDFGMSQWPFDANSQAYENLVKMAETKGYLSEIADFIAWRYPAVRGFDEADRVFNDILKPNIDMLSDAQLTKICADTNKNGQAYGRKKAAGDHIFLKSVIESRPMAAGFSFSAYRNVFR